MRCPFCGNTDTQVKDSRPAEDHVSIRRRRSCPACTGRFTTYERVYRPEMSVIKRNGQISPFNKERIFQSVRIALNGCVDQEKKTEQISNEVNEKIQDIGKDSVPTKTIGEYILKALKETDKMGYVRFYGVFKKVTDPKEYKRIVDTLH